MRDLFLGDLRLDDVASRCFEQLGALERLQLGHVHGFDRAGLWSLGQLSRLRELRLDWLEPDDETLAESWGEPLAAIGALPALELLHLGRLDVPLTPEELRSLSRGPRLRSLELAPLQCLPVDDALVEALPTGLEELALHGRGLSDRSLAALAKRPALSRLSLQGRGLTNAGVAKLAALPRLRELIVHGRGIGAGITAVTRGFPALRLLGIPAAAAAEPVEHALIHEASCPECAR